MKRGDIRWYRFAAPNKRRPVLVLTRDSILAYLDEVTIAPITTTVRDIPSEVVIGPEDGMHALYAINLDHVHTVSKRRLGAIITTLAPSRLVEVRDALLFALGYA